MPSFLEYRIASPVPIGPNANRENSIGSINPRIPNGHNHER